MPRPARDIRPGRVAFLVPAAFALVAGIVADRFVPAVSTAIWAEIAVVAAIFAILIRTRWLSVFTLLVAVAAFGGARHHRFWTDLEPNDLALGDWSTPKPTWVRGVLVEVPQFRPDSHAEGEGRTLTVLEIGGISDGQKWEPVCGRAELAITGKRDDLNSGEAVFAAGTLGAISGPRNPGEADARERSRTDGIRLRLNVNELSGVWPDPDGPSRPFLGCLGRLRTWSYEKLVAQMKPDVAPLAAALLLGRRESVNPNVNDAFARTGTTHLLAISGLQLQAMALAVGLGLRPFTSRHKVILLTVAGVTIGYAVLVGFMPSIVRAMTMTLVICIGGLFDRCARLSNLLAIAAIVTLLINPAHLFDAGCQLSFVCVAALFWLVNPALRIFKLQLTDPTSGVNLIQAEAQRVKTAIAALDKLERRFEPSWKKAIRGFIRWILRGLIASFVIWLATLPLTALRFHLISPISVLWNLPLIPLTTLALIAAGLSLLFYFVWTPFGLACSLFLEWTDALVQRGSNIPGGHTFVAGPSWGWVVGFYVILTIAACATWARWRHVRWLWLTLVIESIVTVVAATQVVYPATLEAEILAVDHGLCIAIRSPSGQTWLYDCGRMRDPRVGRRIIAPYLWSKGIRHIDGVILSHADGDHFNGLPDLLDRFSIGEVLIPDGFGGSTNPDATALLEQVRSRGIEIRTLVAGDRLELGDDNVATILHPTKNWLLSSPDNDRSVVMDLCDKSNHHILFTGDLEGAGLPELLAMPKRPIDVFLAPHHGGRTANPDRLYAWAKPGRVIVSQRRPAATTRDALATQQSRGVTVDRTWQQGALLAQFEPAGLKISSFLKDQQPIPLSFAISPIGWRILIGFAGLLAGAGACLALVVIEWGAWTLVVPGTSHDGC